MAINGYKSEIILREISSRPSSPDHNRLISKNSENKNDKCDFSVTKQDGGIRHGWQTSLLFYGIVRRKISDFSSRPCLSHSKLSTSPFPSLSSSIYPSIYLFFKRKSFCLSCFFSPPFSLLSPPHPRANRKKRKKKKD